MSYTVGSLFSGIGGLDLGLERSGMRVLWQVERDPYARAVLAKHWSRVPCYDDVQAVGAELEDVDLICGGFPCQDLSTAGRQAGIDGGTRSRLWVEFLRVVNIKRPSIVLVENVFGAWRKWVPRVRGDLHAVGYSSLPFRVSAAELGADHERKRAFVVAYRDGVTIRESIPPKFHPPAWEVTTKPLDDRWGTPESRVPRSVYGLPHRLDRTRCLGNAVVPQVVEVLGNLIQWMFPR